MKKTCILVGFILLLAIASCLLGPSKKVQRVAGPEVEQIIIPEGNGGYSVGDTYWVYMQDCLSRANKIDQYYNGTIDDETFNRCFEESQNKALGD